MRKIKKKKTRILPSSNGIQTHRHDEYEEDRVAGEEGEDSEDVERLDRVGRVHDGARAEGVGAGAETHPHGPADIKCVNI